jgi:hypothetical protein
MPGAHQRGPVLEHGFLHQILEAPPSRRPQHQVDLAIAQGPTSSAWLPSTTATSTPGWPRGTAGSFRAASARATAAWPRSPRARPLALPGGHFTRPRAVRPWPGQSHARAVRPPG